MTPIQWMFHYRECQRTAKKEAEKFDNIMSAFETFSLYSHPNMDLDKVMSSIQERRLNKTVDKIKGDIEVEVAKMRADIPKSISIKENKKDKKPILKTMKVPPKRKKKKDL